MNALLVLVIYDHNSCDCPKKLQQRKREDLQRNSMIPCEHCSRYHHTSLECYWNSWKLSFKKLYKRIELTTEPFDDKQRV
jgi:hypothetical protein